MGDHTGAHFVLGGFAGTAGRTVVAPVERVKIIFQISKVDSWRGVVPSVFNERGGGLNGVLNFWRGNGVAVVRVFPYLGCQLASREYYKALITPHCTPAYASFLSGGLAGATAVAMTYPLDLARARLAVLMTTGSGSGPGMMVKVLRDAYGEGGLRGLYSGAGVSCFGAAGYCAIKFFTYDYFKMFLEKFQTDGQEVPYWQRMANGGMAGLFAQTVGYPVDVLRRRLQTGGEDARRRYPNLITGLFRLYQDEGLKRGLYRGLSLNYMKTVPNTMVYLSLFDILKEKYAQRAP